MASYATKFATTGIEREIRNEVDSTLSNFGNMFGGSQATTTADGRAGAGGSSVQIDWTHFNYPPLLRIIHFDTKELPGQVASVVRLVHWAFLVAVVVLIINIFNSFVIGALCSMWIKVVYSILNFLILTPAVGYTFYQGYRALAMSSPTYTTRYVICQGIMCAISLFFMLAPLGSINGLSRFAIPIKDADKHKISGGTQIYWIIAIISESSLWAIVLTLGLLGFYKVWTFNPFHSQEARSTS
eukprot:GHVS01034293.1.p1 GENE.GHVS01034293.1~~GHVS01034293.1.p1  ORF type:complete len:242 (+),score=20.28 GHVS01034293.1:137-862(+)